MSNTNTPATTTSTTATGANAQDNDAILERFKAAYKNSEHYVIDAWLVSVGDDVFIEYQLDTALSDLTPEEMMKKMGEIPREFEGLPTIITWFPKD
ncbi:MAG TPA: hypothetical protein PLC15_19295 [Candidatus Obscuribacter sp.]|nr:hypothetical protein [Candidatus Obscuribacter sp.]HNB17538.1 hypothetical protein [Candidatus Obscuribacter sp.]HND07763.1 hypothetical protein [Candidatus Obscuribacter sp.]HND69685.1 hypothetical protein [Candidatus Obscuribacter sp.]HNG20915.1 hypothetical protein [Candidatus Obscuribacter sp.]